MIGKVLNNRFKVIAQLGTGAMGEVLRATDLQTNQDVALKVMARHLTFDPDMLERFRREGEALKQLRHPNIVSFVEMFEWEGQQIIVMEYVPGGSLYQLIRQGPLPIDRARRIALELCDALTRAHHLNIIHRDIKPENILLAQDGTPRLTDLGVARLVGEGTRLTGTGTQVGTPYYMSPEAWQGQHLDAQTDIWSLGVVLYEMLGGQVPFGGDTMVAVMNKVLTAPLPDLKALRPDVPEALLKIVRKMLARDKAKRYNSMRLVAADLEQVALPSQTTPPPTRTGLKAEPPKPASGRPGLPLWIGLSLGVVVLGVICASLAVGGLGLMTLRNQQATQAVVAALTEAWSHQAATQTSQAGATRVLAATPTALPTIPPTTPRPTPEPASTAPTTPQRVTITWYIGLGGGSQAEQIPLEKAFVDKFNTSQTNIWLETIIVDNATAREDLSYQLASGRAPDIVGPVGTAGRTAFPGAFIDLVPLVKQLNYDLSDIDPAFLQFYTVEGKLEGLPFNIFPEAVYYNRTLFDKAKLTYPPQTVGQKYVLDGKEVDWTFDTLTAVAKRLTLDKNGNNATSPNFDRNNIVQYGYYPQWSDPPRAVGNLFRPFYPMNTNGQAMLPDTTLAAWRWYYLGMWGDQPFMPTGEIYNSDLLGNSNAFSTGRLAMATTHLWYTCCIDANSVPSWDAAVMPAYKGQITAKMHGDTFAIMAASPHPAEAFQVMTYMLGEGSAELYGIYGGLPARKGQQADFLKNLEERFTPNKVNWQVFLDMIPYMDIPNHERGLPNYAQTADLFTVLGDEFRTNSQFVRQSAWDERMATLKTDLQTLIDEGRK